MGGMSGAGAPLTVAPQKVWKYVPVRFAGYSHHKSSRASSSLRPTRKASTNRGLVSSNTAVSISTLETPGSIHSAESSANAEYIGWGNCGPAAIGWSGSGPEPTGTRALILARIVSSGLIRATNCARMGASAGEPPSGAGSGGTDDNVGLR